MATKARAVWAHPRAHSTPPGGYWIWTRKYQFSNHFCKNKIFWTRKYWFLDDFFVLLWKTLENPIFFSIGENPAKIVLTILIYGIPGEKFGGENFLWIFPASCFSDFFKNFRFESPRGQLKSLSDHFSFFLFLPSLIHHISRLFSHNNLRSET